jgi:protein TonB
MIPTATLYSKEQAPGRAGVIVTLALHGAVVATALLNPTARSAMAPSLPIIIDLIAPDPATAPRQPPMPLPIRAQPAQAQPVAPLALAATPSEAPAAIAAPASPQPGLPPTEAAPFRPALAPAVAIAPAVLVSPHFDAAYLQNPPPVYPPLARRLGEQGRALLRVYVTADGIADTVELRSTSGSDRLDRAALEAVRRWRFVPARQGDARVAAWVLVPISFSIEG